MQLLTGSHEMTLFLKITLTGVAVVFLTGVGALLILGLLRWLRFNRQREHAVRLTNQGNVSSVYQLAVESSEPLLGFQFFMNGVPLIELPPVPASPVVAAPATPKNNSRSSPNKPPVAPTGGDPGAGRQWASQGKAISATAGTVASLLGTVGSILPGSMGSALKDQGAAARNVQTKASVAAQAPEDAQRKVDALQRDSLRLAGRQPQGTGGAQQAIPDRMSGVEETAVHMPDTLAAPGPQRAVSLPRLAACFQTGPVEPGTSIALALRISPRKWRFKASSYLYTLTSQQVPLEKLGKQAVPLIRQGIVHLKPEEAWRFWLRGILAALIAISSLAGLFFCISAIWR